MASGKGVSHVRALVSSDYTLKRCLDLHKVVPALLEQKSLPKSFRRKAKLSEKMKNLDVFLGAVRELNLDGFALFLETLDSLQDEKHNEVLQVLSTEIRLVSLPPEAQATKIIEKIVMVHYHETETKDESEVKPYSTEEEEQLYLSTVLPLPHDVKTTEGIERIEKIAISDAPPTEGIHPTEEQAAPPHVPPLIPTVGNVELQTFTKVGGTFHSSTHGVRVHIPQESLPPTIQPFELKMTASLRGPYKFSEDCELCTAVIHLSCDPPIDEFHDWVTVEFPHCATEPQTECARDLDHLCIMTAKDELMSGVYEFYEDPEIEVDFSDMYKVVFKTKHFSGSAGTRLKDRTRIQKSPHGVQKSQHRMKLRGKKERSLDSHCRSMLEKKTSAEVHRSASVPDSKTSQYTAEVHRSASVPDSETSQYTAEVHRSASVPDSETSHLSQYTAEVHRSASVPHRSASVPDSETSHSSQYTAEVQSSLSLPSSTAQYATRTGNRYYVAMCTPMDRSQLQWNFVFLVSYCHPTGLKDIEEAASRILDLSGKVKISQSLFEFDPAVRYLEFEPESWQGSGWKVESIKYPAVITETDVLNYFQLPEDTKDSFPHSLCYDVDGKNRTESLSLRIHVKNARCCGKEVSFRLTSTAASPAGATVSGKTFSKQDPLTESDIFEISTYLCQLNRTHFLNLGMCLGLRHSSLKDMMNSETYKTDVIAAWIRREGDVDQKTGAPTWSSLVKALMDPYVGQEGIAHDISRAKNIATDSNL